GPTEDLPYRVTTDGNAKRQLTHSQRRRSEMTNRGLIVGITLVAALAASGCATKVRMSSSKMCTAHGGTYNASTQMCTYKAQTLSAKQAFEAPGGPFIADQNGEGEKRSACTPRWRMTGGESSRTPRRAPARRAAAGR